MTTCNADAGTTCTIYLLRHGQPDLPPGGKRYIGKSDFPLSEVGRRQAGQLHQYFSGVNLTGIFCSDLGRSRQTADIIARGHSLEISPVPQMAEIDMGCWEGMTFDDIRRHDPSGFEQRGNDPARFRPPGGESFQDLQDRVLPAFRQIIRNAQSAIAIVGHAGVNRVLLCHLLKIPLQDLFTIRQDYAAMNVIQKAGAACRVDQVNVRV